MRVAEKTLQELVRRLSKYNERPALVAVDEKVRVLSFSELVNGAEEIAQELRDQGVATGEPIGLCGPNSVGWAVACLGILAAGAAVMPLEAKIGEADRDATLSRMRCRLLYAAAAEARPILRVLQEPTTGERARTAGDRTRPDAAPETVALLLHTSGTAGLPKFVPLSHTNVLSSIDALRDALRIGPSDRALLPLPLHHAYPLVAGLLTPLSCGASVVLPRGISGPELMRAFRAGEANWLIGVPRLYETLVAVIVDSARTRGAAGAASFRWLLNLSQSLAQRGRGNFGRFAFSALRKAIAPKLYHLASGGAALEGTTERTLIALGYDVLVGYGLTETSPIVAFNRPGHARFGSAGQPIAGVDVRLARADAQGIGEIEVHGANVFSGYRCAPEATAGAFTTDGWFRTGDLGRIDAQGYLYLHGRVLETLVLPGGEKLNPELVEAGYGSPLFDEVAVLLEGGKLVALVVPSRLLRADPDPQSREQAIRETLMASAAKLPRYIQLTGFAQSEAALPRTELGKLRRYLLPQLYRAARAEPEESVRAGHPWSAADRALLDEPGGREFWTWLEARFPQRRLRLEMSPQLDLGLDSLGLIALTLAMENQLGISLSEDALERVRTLRELVEAVVTAKAAPASSTLQKRWLPEPGVAERALYFAGHGVNRALVRTLISLDVAGLEHLPRRGPYVLCPNHASYLDPPVLAAALPWSVLRRLYWAGSVDVMFSTWWKRLFSRWARALPIDPVRGALAGLLLSATVLQRGEILVWFPEGWRTTDGTLQPFLPGIGALLMREPVPVVPVYIDGAFSAWPPSRRLPHPGRVTVRFGSALDPTQCSADREHPEEAIAAAVKAAVTQLRPMHFQVLSLEINRSEQSLNPRA